MASHSQPPSPAKPRSPPEPTTILALTDDLLRDIFLRLPSLPSLVRAALACRPFLAAVRSSPAFRRRFRELHPPPLLGFFGSDIIRISCFTPVRRRSDPDLAAAVRGVDVFLTRVPSLDDAFPGWRIQDCSSGRLLLQNLITEPEQLAVYDPLTGALDLVRTPPEKISHGRRGKFIDMEYLLLPPGGEAPSASSFRVVYFCHDKSRGRVAVFSVSTKEWQILPWSEPMPGQPASGKYWLLKGTHVNGLMCWSHTKHPYIVVLDTSTWQFSCIDLPEFLIGQGHLYSVGGTKDGKLCIVAALEFTLLVWFRKVDAARGIETKWMLHNIFPLDEVVLQATEGSREDHVSLKVLGILDGTVYLSTFETFRDENLSCWYLSFSMESSKLEKIFYTNTSGWLHPYTMAWPSSLVCNNLSP
ncbi:hypothetical protein QOZ80_8AG0634690 [Eleusine coracana subsp. coracana]|nr:hypothetical protein QOZ80_8AG0634690 [Eleusine coracana subsp. coracana]